MNRLDLVMQAAVQEGLLPTGARPAPQDVRPWPVVLLTALGAWLATLPLLGVVLLMFDGVPQHSAVLYAIGTLLLVGAVVVLRASGVAFFVEQLAVPALLIGGGAFAFALFRDLPPSIAALALAALAVAVPLAIPKAWVRVPLGALAAVLLVLAWAAAEPAIHSRRWTDDMRFWWAWHVDLGLWLALGGLPFALLKGGANARVASALDSLRAGWLLATLAGLAWWSGMTFLLGGVIDPEWPRVGRSIADHGDSGGHLAMQAASVALSIVAAGWAARCWPTLRHVTAAAVAAVLVAMAWFMPSLGAVWLALAVCMTASRWRLATVAAVAAAWIIGSFYYALGWSLGDKALVLVLAAVLLGALAWLGTRHPDDRDERAAHAAASVSAASVPAALASAALDSSALASSKPDPAPDSSTTASSTTASSTPAPSTPVRSAVFRSGWLRAGFSARPFAGIAVTAVLVLAVANGGIWQKETLLATGRPVFVELAPVDPRSLAQGDYMALGYRLLEDERLQTLPRVDVLPSSRRPKVVVVRDARGVATLLRVDDGRTLGPDDLRIELAPSSGHWTLVTDAWFFRQGDSARWARARYGEFRVGADGSALLVGLRGPALEAL